MNKFLVCTSMLGLVGSVWDQDFSYLDPTLPPEKRVDILMEQMTLTEKIGQMNQYLALEKMRRKVETNAAENTGNRNKKVAAMLADLDAGLIGSTLFVNSIEESNALQKRAEQSRLKIPLLHAMDSIHGHCAFYGTTIFPTAIGQASSFDLALVEKSQEITAKEMRATGYHWNFWPYMSVARDARWGRVGETFGEDPLVVSRMVTASVKGLQGDDYTDKDRVIACAKVLLGDGQSINGLNFAPTDLSERTLREIFLPPGKAAGDAGCRTFMVAHNEVNGIPCHADRRLLTGILREEWGFEGYTISDWMDVERLNWIHKIAHDQKEAVFLAVYAGVDVHMHGPDFIGPLTELVEEGKISEDRIDRTVRAMLLDKFRMGLFNENRYVDPAAAERVLANAEHRAVALELARNSIVLLKNNNQALPLSKQLKSVLVAGPLADSNALVGDWVYAQPPENITTVLAGIQNLVGAQMKVSYASCSEIMDITDEDIERAVQQAKEVDSVIMVVGGNDARVDEDWKTADGRRNRTGGENRARSEINLAGRQLEMLKAVWETGTPMVVVLINGRPLSIEWVADHVDGIIEAWQPGMNGGVAVAEVLFGDVNPSGKLPISFPRSAGHIQTFYNHKPSTYYREYKFGKTQPLWWFGHGLSYTTFKYSRLKVPQQVTAGSSVPVSIVVENTGTRSGDEVVFLYINDMISSVTTPVKLLKDWARIQLEPGEKKTVEFTLTQEDLALLDINLESVVEPGVFEVMIGGLKKEFVLE